ncbi:hypothetical protein [Urbifossiella limnaea]|uniref:Uncharacterized protein n=1 Tax=Urbifossiella limnaea TaxID=2528023 RepID=A0A517XWC7_9BACT|nr:hypothetical protein [Urbifossiella limnaea]QDU21797.1 hypothetical protein ETAA1_37700 [Urbifossiella limnaea]
MQSLTLVQEEMAHLRHARFEHRRVKDMVVALGSPADLGRQISATAADLGRSLWRFGDLYDPATPLPAGFRFVVRASSDILASLVWLRASGVLLNDLLAGDGEELGGHRLPALCFRGADIRGGLVLFADDGSLPLYPHWHTSWPKKSSDTRYEAIWLASWAEWVRWAAALPPRDHPSAAPPVGLSTRDRLFHDFLATALGPTPTTTQQRLLRQAGGRRWVVATNVELADATRLTVRQVRAAITSLVSTGLAERLTCRGDGAAWGVRLVTPC